MIMAMLNALQRKDSHAGDDHCCVRLDCWETFKPSVQKSTPQKARNSVTVITKTTTILTQGGKIHFKTFFMCLRLVYWIFLGLKGQLKDSSFK